MRTLPLIAVLIILLCISMDLKAQTAGMAIDKDRKAWININIGGVWQSSDVRSQLGSGSGLTFDYYFIRNNTSVFGLGARAQYFTTTSIGVGVTQDFGIQNNTSLNGTGVSPDYASLPDNYVYQNHSTEIIDLSGNIILSLNKLRATTGLHLYLFGGLGGTGYITKLDQLDDNRSLYDYTTIDPSRQENVIQDDLKNLRDNDYETFAESGSEQKWVLTPTIGAGFAFQLSPRVQLGFEHKVGFTGTDLLDGNQWDATNQLSSNNDTYHFSSISVSIGIGKLFEGGGSGLESNLTTDPAPIIEIIEPNTSLFTSSSCTADIRARITNINGKEDIAVDRSRERMNPSEYTWNASTKILEIHENLNGSTVSYSISVNSTGGSASRVVIINCAADTPASIVVQPPVIDITSPSSNDFETPDCMSQIFANISNVRGLDEIEIIENGRTLNYREYSWNRNTQTLRVNRPVEESSSFLIKATNSAGSASEEINVTCIQSAPLNTVLAPPVLNVIIPGDHPYTTPDCVAKLSIRTENVTDKNQITVIENGKRLSPILYVFNPESGLLSLTRGLPGEGEYYIKAQNAAGTTSVVQDFICPQVVEREVFITICHFPPNDRSNPQTISIPTIEWPQHANHGDTQGACPVVEEPGIIINNPSTPTLVVENCRASINATVLNIEYKEDIEVLQNGKSIPFGYAGNTVSVNNIAFTGTSTFTIMVTNLQGTITKSVAFVCQPKPVKMITICHSENGSAPQTLSIPSTEWSRHQTHGDTQGICPVIERPVVTIISPSTSKETLTDCSASIQATVTNVQYKSDITVKQNGSPVPFAFIGNQITVSDLPFSGTANFIITATNSAGSSIKKVLFVCQPQVETITICHTEGGVPQTIIIPAPDWQVHASHGDIQGACPVVERPLVTIISPISSPVTLENCVVTIQASVENIKDKRDIVVTRNGTPVNFNFSGNALSISNLKFTGTANFAITAKNSAGASVQTVSFICEPPVKIITICHSEGGSIPQTISIPDTEWSVHSAHGDTQGSCPIVELPVVSIQTPSSSPVSMENCLATIRATVENITDKQNISVTQNGSPVDFNMSGNVITISNVSFTGTANYTITASNSAGSSFKTVSFVCQPKVEMITICHTDIGGEPQTIVVPAPDWQTHASHGDTQGACPVVERPLVTISAPTSSPITVENCIASIRATVENIKDKQGITVTQNGTSVNFEFTGNTVSISNSKFTGTANFAITAKNSAGTSVQTVSFICKPPVKIITICHSEPGGIPQTISIPDTEWSVHSDHGDTQGSCPIVEPPLVSIQSPSSSPQTLENCAATIRATVKNITDKQNISVTKNGTPIDFNFAGDAVTLSNISFTGTVNFTITAINSAGSSVKTVSFICKPPVEMITICHSQTGTPSQTISIPSTEWSTHAAHGDTQGECPIIEKPIVSITSPLSNQVTVENCVASIRASVDNISDKQGISITHNGSQIDFNYSGNSLTISNYSFTGTANFVITATNTAGSSAQTVSFVCKPPIEVITICHTQTGQQPQTVSIPATEWPTHAAHGDSQGACPAIEKPVLSITSPSSSPVTLENCIANVRATVRNITSKQDITVTQNGSPMAFGFTGNNVTVSNISFEGTSNIEIIATNVAGSVKQSVSFICQTKKITICHYPPGNKNNPQTITISESAWPAHEKHGDKQGACNN
jgi:hypothetical protein